MPSRSASPFHDDPRRDAPAASPQRTLIRTTCARVGAATRRLAALCLVTLLLATAAATAQTDLQAPPQAGELGGSGAGGTTAQPPARVIVKFKAGSQLMHRHPIARQALPPEVRARLASRADALATRTGLALSHGRPLTEHAQVIYARGISAEALARRLAAQPDVEFAVVDQRRQATLVPSDSYFNQGPPIAGLTGGPVSGQWYLRPADSTLISATDAQGAWDITTGRNSIVVAVLDTGVRLEHPELAGRLLPGYNMISNVNTSNDGGVRDDDPSDPGDWVSSAESADSSGPFYRCAVTNSTWHGTHVASLISAASNNGAGMAGMAWNVKVLPVRVLGKCGGFDSDIIAGMLWAAGISVPGVPDNPYPAQVINMSLAASTTCPQTYVDAINSIMGRSRPPVIVVAAGNSSGDAVASPANCASVIGVAGLRHIGTKVGFSDLGPEIAISAPGGNCVNTATNLPCLYPILSATNSGTTSPVASTYSDSFNYSVGTSYSAPLVAGAAALMLSVDPTLTPAEVKTLLQSTARPFPTTGAAATVPVCHAPNSFQQLECYCTTSTCGTGMLDARAAVAAALQQVRANLRLVAGWNLLGNSSGSALTVAASFGNAAKVTSVWKWLPSGSTPGVSYPTWAFYAPGQADGGQAYAAAHGFDYLTSIQPGEGFWVNAAGALSVPVGAGSAVASATFQPGAARPLASGWSLIATGDTPTPAQFNATLGNTTPPANGPQPVNLFSVWAWDALQSKWYYWSPAAQNNGTLASFISTRSHLDFSGAPTTPDSSLSPTMGVWVNAP